MNGTREKFDDTIAQLFSSYSGKRGRLGLQYSYRSYKPDSQGTLPYNIVSAFGVFSVGKQSSSSPGMTGRSVTATRKSSAVQKSNSSPSPKTTSSGSCRSDQLAGGQECLADAQHQVHRL